MSRSTPPKLDELELSIIGPGRGECIILHLGNNEWCIVDSCIARGSNQPVAAQYLQAFAGALNGIILVVATHWHDDHIRGLSSLLRVAPRAEFACSAAIDKDNFYTLVGTASETLQGRSGVDEFNRIFNHLVERRQPQMPAKLVSPLWAIQNRTLIHLSDPNRSFQAKVTALSPSDGTVQLAFKNIAQWLPKPGEPQRRIANRAPNLTSVVLWIEAGDKRALLGADLEHTQRLGDGWIGVLSSIQDHTRATVFKIPHHGSLNADFEEVWTKMLTDNPIAVVTPFSAGVRLPTDSDLNRLGNRTDQLYCTARGPGKPPVRDPVVEKTVKRVASDRAVIEGQPGHVRIRWSIPVRDSAPTVELFNGAYAV